MAEPILVDALKGRDPRLIAFAVEALLRSEPEVARAAATPAVMELHGRYAALFFYGGGYFGKPPNKSILINPGLVGGNNAFGRYCAGLRNYHGRPPGGPAAIMLYGCIGDAAVITNEKRGQGRHYNSVL